MFALKKRWSDRGQLGEKKQKKLLLDFMPAALEIQERPPSPVGRLVGWIIMALFCIGVLWAALSHVNVVVTAEGKVIPTGKVKIVQSTEEGRIKEILVSDGQTVSAGDALVVIDETSAVADRRRLEIESGKALLSIQRLKSELGQKVLIGEGLIDAEQSLATTNRLLSANNRAFQEQLNLLSSELSQAKAAKAAAVSDVSRLKAKVDYYHDLLPKRQRQADIGLIAGQEVDEISFQLKTASKEHQSAQGRLNEARANQRHVQEKKAALISDNDSELLSELAVAEYEYNALEQELVKIKERLSQQVLKAPVDGVVQQLAVNTIGGYISRGQELMVIVPKDSVLQLDIQILDKDIGFVEAGMPVEVKVNAYEYTRYGMLQGSLQWIGNDAVVDDIKGPVYPAKVLLDDIRLPNKVKGRVAQVSPGMGVNLDVQIGKRRLIEYFLSPLIRYKKESLNER